MTKAEAAEDDRRGQSRAPITLRVDYKRLNTFFADYTKNISKGGTFIRTTKPLALGTEFMFVLSLPGVAPRAAPFTAASPPRGASENEGCQLELRGIVKWVVPESDASADRFAGMGIQFVFVDDAQRAGVENTVATMMNDALGPLLAGKLLGRPPRDGTPVP